MTTSEVIVVTETLDEGGELTEAGESLLAGIESLTPAELRGAQRMATPELRRRAAVSRIKLRRWLADRTGAEAASLRLLTGPHGKPFLPDYPGCQFNVAHCGGLALYVFSQVPIGVDLERIDTRADFSLVAETFFTSAERALLRALTPRQRTFGFFVLWTAKEAWLKATGLGLSFEPENIELGWSDVRHPFLASIAGSRREAARWSLRLLEPQPGYIASIVAETRDISLKLQDRREPRAGNSNARATSTLPF